MIRMFNVNTITFTMHNIQHDRCASFVILEAFGVDVVNYKVQCVPGGTGVQLSPTA